MPDARIILSERGAFDRDKGTVWLSTAAHSDDAIRHHGFQEAMLKAIAVSSGARKRKRAGAALDIGMQNLVRALIVGRIYAERLAGDNRETRKVRRPRGTSSPTAWTQIDTDAAIDLGELFKQAWPGKERELSSRTMDRHCESFRRVLPHCLALFLYINRRNVADFYWAVKRNRPIDCLWYHKHSDTDVPLAEYEQRRANVTKARLSDFYNVVARMMVGDYDTATELTLAAQCMAPLIWELKEEDGRTEIGEMVDIRISRRRGPPTSIRTRLRRLHRRRLLAHGPAGDIHEALAQHKPLRITCPPRWGRP